MLELPDEGASFCGKLLADLGAEVIRVEPPPAASAQAAAARPSRERFWTSYHDPGKRNITLNCEHPAGHALLLRLAERADVLLESLVWRDSGARPLSYDVLQRRNPRIIHARLTGFGETGPHRAWRGCDLVAAAAGGQMQVTGETGREPVKLGGTQGLYLGSLHAAVGIVMALIRRNRTGCGERVDISLQEAAASGLDHVLVRYFAEGAVAGRRGHRYWNDAFLMVPCRDGWLQLSLLGQWDTLVEWMDSEGMAGPLKNPAYREAEHRRTHFAEVEETIARWTAQHTRAELFETAQAMGFPWAPVCTLDEVLASPQLSERDFFIPVTHAGETIRQPASPCRFFSQTSSIPYGSPRPPGFDNLAIYRDELGLSETDLARLEAGGAI
jgi:crotonobetainyl-CoA:carnitine CoA-transferase CaiB-like acyl-CoA transferase